MPTPPRRRRGRMCERLTFRELIPNRDRHHFTGCGFAETAHKLTAACIDFTPSIRIDIIVSQELWAMTSFPDWVERARARWRYVGQDRPAFAAVPGAGRGCGVAEGPLHALIMGHAARCR
jgi:hypothetical protein